VIRAFQEECRSAKVVPEVSLQTGRQEIKAERLIIGQKGEHPGMVGDMMGSNANHISRNSINPCMVVGPLYQPIMRVLAAYDGSPHASQALHVAVELAGALKSVLHIITVREHEKDKTAKQTSPRTPSALPRRTTLMRKPR